MSSKLSGLAAALLFAAPVFAHATPVEDLKSTFSRTVTHQLSLPQEVCQDYATRFAQALAEARITLDRDQFAVLVDRSPKVQALTLLVTGPSGTQCVGAASVSTGSTGRFDHYYSPLGVFDHTVDNPDFRAEGTKNEHGIRGYGRKGLRIYDMGWQDATKGWGQPETRQIRFQLHSTDPDVLEPRLGRPDSKGCIRMPATLNTFMDIHGVLDAAYVRLEAQGQTPWVLAKHRVRTGLEGEYVVVVDTHPAQRPEWASPGGRVAVSTAPADGATPRVEVPAVNVSAERDPHEVIDVGVDVPASSR